jgi:outer membrane protein, heavy metal efflux system
MWFRQWFAKTTIVTCLFLFEAASPAQQADPLVPAGSVQLSGREPMLTFAELQNMAIENNPTLRQAAAEIQAALGRRRQAGLWPNPRIGYTGEEIRGGSFGGGQHGVFVEQDIILGGKLAARQRLFEQEIKMAELEAEEQRMRVTTSVKLGFFQVLASQETLASLRELLQVAVVSADTSKRLLNIGQLDETEVLQAEIEVQQAELEIAREESRLRHLWTGLASVVGRPDLPVGRLAGSLEDGLPASTEQALLDPLLTQSPAVKIAEANVGRASAELAREQRLLRPDLAIRGGLQQNRERLDSGQRTGFQGFAEVGIQIPLFNRNQGGVQAAMATRERAEQERIRVQLVLRERAAATVQRYTNARITATRYKAEILPRTERAYELMLNRWGQMAASYPQVLLSQRALFQARTQYISALSDVWANAVAMEGYLLVDGLEAPTRPSEVDLPVRETNIPTSRGISAVRE